MEGKTPSSCSTGLEVIFFTEINVIRIKIKDFIFNSNYYSYICKVTCVEAPRGGERVIYI